MANHTNIHATDKDGKQVSLSHTYTDAPVLPAPNIKQLYEIDPKLVDWVIQQTEIESSHRRARDMRVNGFVFIERISGVIVGGIVALFGLGVSAYIAIKGHDWAATLIGGGTLVSIVALLAKRKSDDAIEDPPTKQPQKRTRK